MNNIKLLFCVDIELNLRPRFLGEAGVEPRLHEAVTGAVLFPAVNFAHNNHHDAEYDDTLKQIKARQFNI